ncbi:DUF2125 domain-containing protein [Pseudopelagicola sp. nBUS_20]|uniref:DUF2125 domain-containing protein n=1 Tax=Pseudopelagicola sp. nBUS_20 TaxID=3395317 RepID=UPI003EBB5EE6
MIIGKCIATTSLLASFSLSTVAWADVGSQEVWESWQTYLDGFGYEISGSEQSVGNNLNVNDLSLSMKIPDNEGSIKVNLGDIQFVDKGDGTVEVVMPNQIPVLIKTSSDGKDADIIVTISHKGLSMIVSGASEDMTYAYNATEFGVELTSAVVNGEAIPNTVANIVMSGIMGRSEMAFGETITTRQKASVSSLSYIVQATDPDSGGSIDLEGFMNGMEAEIDGVMPLGDYSADPMAFFNAGFAIAGGYAVDGTSFDVTFVENGAPSKMTAKTGAAEMGVDMSGSIIAYGGDVLDVSVSLSGPEIPLPVDVSFGELGYGFEMPLKASDAQQDFGFGIVLGDLSVSEMIWSMIDPGQVLAHDPATLALDVSGKATIFKDIMTMDENSDEIPGELNALTLNDVQLIVAGAGLTGTGDFVFDNTDMQSFDGFPRPEGTLNINIVGINALMDNLVTMGLLPEDQVMGARMMLSMFAVPGAGEDELNSTIEVNRQGHVLANGQRLK